MKSNTRKKLVLLCLLIISGVGFIGYSDYKNYHQLLISSEWVQNSQPALSPPDNLNTPAREIQIAARRFLLTTILLIVFTILILLTAINYFLRNKEKEKRAAELIRSEKRLIRAQEIAHMGCWELNLVTDTLICSEEACRIYGIPIEQQQMSIHNWLSFTHPEDLGFLSKKIKESRDLTKGFSCYHRIIHKDGAVRYVYVESKMEFDGRLQPTTLHGIVKDETEKRTAADQMEFDRNKIRAMEQEIVDQRVQEQKSITRAILNAQEKERNHIGQELHDNISQILVSSKLFLGAAGAENETIRGLIEYPLELIDNSIEEIRQLSSRYVTPIKNVDLRDLLQTLLNKLAENTSIDTTLEYDVSNRELNDDLKLNIYRIIQEQINNIVKHAAPGRVDISVQAEPQSLHIEMSDDGKGFDVTSKRKGIGIQNMLNRIDSFNGKMDIESSPGHGCRIQIAIPY